METQTKHRADVKERRRHRKWPWVLGGILVIILLILLLVPVFLSSRGFTQWVQARISRSTGGQADIGSLSVGWLRGVQVAGFSFRGENGWSQVDIDRITTQPSYSSLLSGTLALDRTVINQPRVALDLRDRPAATEERPPFDLDNLSRINDVVVRDASIRVTDTRGQTVQIADLDSDLSLRKPGRTSRFNASMVVAQAQGPARIEAAGQLTPNRETGWSLRGTTGDFTVEVNDLDLNSLAPILELAGVQVQAGGEVSANVVSGIQDGQIENLNATVVGRNLDITGEALQGDHLQTSQLNVRADLTRKQDVVNIDQLNVQTDWANVSAAGRAPATVRSLTELRESAGAYDLQGKFNVDLAALLSQLPNTVGIREGTEITGGRATGTISTTSRNGRATLVAEAQVAGLAAVVNNEKVSLSKPVLATVRLASDKQGTQLEGLDVSAPFAKVDASGNFKQIKYEGQVDLAALQAELGPFVNLGPYELTGQVTSKGQVSIEENVIGTSGTASAQQLVLAAPDGNSVSEPAANVDFALAVDRADRVLTVNTLTAALSFGTISMAKATVPLGADAGTPLQALVSARQVDLSRLEPYLTMFMSFPPDMEIDGIAQSQVAVTREDGVYHLSTDATRIQDFALVSPEKERFEQPQVTAQFDIYVDPDQKTINIQNLQVESPQIKIRKGEIRQTSRDDTARLQGTLDAQWDWAAVGQAISAFVPGRVELAGQRQLALNFASTYPADEPNALLAHLNSAATIGFDRAAYLGLNVGPTEIDVRIENGLMQVRPFSTTLNKGLFRFAAEANLGQTPILLRTPAPLQMAQGVQITQEMVDSLLRHVNPIFADAINVSGAVNFESQSLAIPLTAGHRRQAALAGTISIQDLRLQASLINQILGVIRESVRDQVLTVRPTKIALANGVLRYDDMQIEVGDNPINFGGAIGPDGKLDMTVTLPYTLEGRTVRVGEEARAGARIRVPLTGTVDNPQLNLQKLPESLLQEELRRGIERLFD